MLLRKMFFATLLLIATNVYSQDTKEKDITNVLKLTFLNPGISYEKRIGPFQSLYMHAFLGIGFAYGYSSSFGDTFEVYTDPGATLQYRYYYNHEKRTKRGKRTEMNSLNYIAGFYNMSYTAARISDSDYEEENKRPIHYIGVSWGLQRNYKKHFSLDLNIGPGYLFTTTTTPDETGNPKKGNGGKFTLVGGLNLGFWINKAK